MIFDAHNDILTGGLTAPEVYERIAAAFGIEKVRGITLALWTTEMAALEPARVLGRFDAVKPLADKFELRFAVEDLAFLSPDGIPLLKYYDVVYASLTWNYLNAYGGGANTDEGLTAEGVIMLRGLEEAGIIADTAHLSERSFKDFCAIASAPVFCSHACLYDECAHRRNLKDWQISEIVSSGGFLGLTLAGDFLAPGGFAIPDDVIRHIDRFVQKYGDLHLGLGTDFYGTANLPVGIKTYKSLLIIVEKLRALGYNERAIENIMSGNYERFLRRGANDYGIGDGGRQFV